MVDQPGGAGLEGGHDAGVEVPGVSSDDVDKKNLCLRSSNHHVVDQHVMIDDF